MGMNGSQDTIRSCNETVTDNETSSRPRTDLPWRLYQEMVKLDPHENNEDNKSGGCAQIATT